MALIKTDIFGTIDDLVADSIALIKKYEPEEGYRVLFSGGKDSIVCLDLVKKAGVKYNVHMQLTSVDPPELLEFIKKNYPCCQFHKPKMSMFNLILKKKTLPTRKMAFCCDLIKHHLGDNYTSVMGIRKEESAGRSVRTVFSKRSNNSYYLCPILEWASDEIWEYIKANQLPYPSLYDEGFHRIGCIGCPKSGKNRYKDFNRWPKFEKAYRNTIKKMVKLRKNKKMKPLPFFETPEKAWSWWMEELPKEDKNQIKMDL